MCPDWVSNPGPLALESDTLPTERRGPAVCVCVCHHKRQPGEQEFPIQVVTG